MSLSSPMYFGLVLILEPVVLYIELMDGWIVGISSEFIWTLWKYMQIYFIYMYMNMCMYTLYAFINKRTLSFSLGKVHNFLFSKEHMNLKTLDLLYYKFYT